MTLLSCFHLPQSGLRGRVLKAVKGAGAALLTGLLIAGCGGGGSAPSAASPAATGDGAPGSAASIVAKPATGDCGPSGTDAKPSPLLNSRLDCAP